MTPEQVARWLYNYLNFPEFPKLDRDYDVPDRLLVRYINLVNVLDINEIDKQTIEKSDKSHGS